MRPERAHHTRRIAAPPSSGFYPTAPEARGLDVRGGAPSPGYAEGLLRTGDLLLCAGARPLALDALLTAVEATIPLRALVLVDVHEGETRARTTRSAAPVDEVDIARIETDARAAFAYFAELSESIAGSPEAPKQIALPLVASDGGVFAVLLAYVTAAATEGDLAFLDAVAAQLAVALARDRRAASMRRTLRRAKSELARERVAHEATRAAARDASFLTDALSILNVAPDPTRDLGRLARLVSLRLADGCVLKLGAADALERAASTRLPDAQIDRAIARLVPRTFLLRRTLVAASAPESIDILTEDGWQMDAEAEAARRELAVEWLVCAPVPGSDGTIHGAVILVGDAPMAHGDPRTIHVFTRLLGAAVERAGPYRMGLRAVADRDRVLSMVAHELRQPLSASLLNVSAVLGRMPTTGERRRTGQKELERVKRGLKRLARLTEDLLDVSRVDVPGAHGIRIECARMDASDQIAEATELLGAVAAERGIELRSSAAPLLPAVWADAGRVQQVLLNLIGNALKFTPRGGTITVDARAREGAVAISVSDTGSGIPEADRASVFERFWQAESTASLGAGIGLTITKGIVEAHGGRLDLESAVGAGTTFTFTLPVA